MKKQCICGTIAIGKPAVQKVFGLRTVNNKQYAQSRCRKCRTTGGNKTVQQPERPQEQPEVETIKTFVPVMNLLERPEGIVRFNKTELEAMLRNLTISKAQEIGVGLKQK